MIHKDSLSEMTKAVVNNAFRLSAELGHDFVGSEHLLWSISQERDCAAPRVLRNVGLDSSIIRDIIEQYDGAAEGSGRMLTMTPESTRVFELAEAQAKKLHHTLIEPEHLLLGILQERDCAAARLIISTGADTERITNDLLARMGREWPPQEKPAPLETKNAKNETKALDQFSLDLTEAARKDELDPVIGRSNEVQRLIQILSRRTKNNPVLIGEPGVGKTAVAEGLSQRIVEGDIPENLTNKRLLSLDLSAMLAGTKFRGDFEERIKSVIDEVKQSDNVILFIDELHTLIGAGNAEGGMDAANILKPALSRGEIQVIGATTINEYRKHIEKDVALERRFQTVTVGEPSSDDCFAILTGLRPRYEEHHKLKISDEALRAAVTLSVRYIQDRYLPDKAIDLMDEAAARVRTRCLNTPPFVKEMEEKLADLNSQKRSAVKRQNFEWAAHLRDRQRILREELEARKAEWIEAQGGTVGAEDIAGVVSMWTGIPVTMLTEDETARLLRLEDTLHQRVVGQEEAVKSVAKAIRRGRVGLGDPGRPVGSFLFLGPTGVGKTELCKALAEALFQDESAMIRVDMSEMMERHTVSKLIGSPPGYVGYDEGGQLTEKVRRKPYCIILFDEVEKAHPDVWNILLQIMEDGRLTDAQGRKVDFKNAVIAMTSNIGASEITDKRKALGFGGGAIAGGTSPHSEIREKVMESVKKTFRPELLNRIDDIVVFHQLDRDHIRLIAEGMIKKLEARMTARGISLTVDDAAMDILTEKGFDPVFGARPLRRVIQSGIEDIAAERLLAGEIQEGDTMLVTAKDGELTIEKLLLPSRNMPVLANTVSPSC